MKSVFQISVVEGKHNWKPVQESLAVQQGIKSKSFARNTVIVMGITKAEGKEIMV